MANFGYIPSLITDSTPMYCLQGKDTFQEYSLKGKSVNKVYDQGTSPMCAAYAGTSLLEYIWEIRRDQNTIKTSNLPRFLYDKRSHSNVPGMPLSDMINILRGIPGGITGYAVVDKGVYAAQNAIMYNGPILAAFYVKSMGPTFWKGSENLGGHAVLITGYDSKGFIIKNSWGTEWGNRGFTTIPYSEWDLCVERWTTNW